MKKTRNRIGIALGAVALCVSFATPAVAGESEIAFQFGLLFPDRDITGVTQDIGEFEPAVGARGGWRFTESIGMFVDGWYSQPQSILSGSIDTLAGRTGVEFWLGGSSSDDKRWFLDVGAGVKDFDVSSGSSDAEVTFGSVSIGQRIRFRDRNFFRWEARSDHSIDDDDLPAGADLWNPQINFAIGTIFGGERTDSDGDGVLDGRDKCPDTPRGATVDARGCPKDSDSDGVYDGIDKCPDTPAGYPVDADGCPTDSDGDGVVDGKDDCPDTPRGASVDAKGCPKDSDGDGVYDGLDKCPNTPTGAQVGPDGCPKDSDGDGVMDGLDKCPNTPSGAKVDADGCPMDSDGDGVYDGIDKCPGTPSGTAVGADGCPEKRLFTEDRKTFVLQGVNFETDSAKLTGDSTGILDGVAATLKEWPNVTVEVGGHTDSRGSDAYNQSLSERRAKSVMDYLVSKGIDARRMTSRGYGEAEPIADNGTSEGRLKNRRVELKQTN